MTLPVVSSDNKLRLACRGSAIQQVNLVLPTCTCLTLVLGIFLFLPTYLLTWPGAITRI